jgi:hypothetical protein
MTIEQLLGILFQGGAAAGWAAAVLITGAFLMRKILSERQHEEIVGMWATRLQEVEKTWSERYGEVKQDRDRYRDLSLRQAETLARSTEVNRQALSERISTWGSGQS